MRGIFLRYTDAQVLWRRSAGIIIAEYAPAVHASRFLERISLGGFS